MWRKKYLSKLDQVTKKEFQQIRGKNGKILTPFQLVQECPKFIDAVMNNFGKNLPFYEEFTAGTNYIASSPDNQARVQISVFGRLLPLFGEIDTLRSFWRDVDVNAKQQSLFTHFKKGKERLSTFVLFSLGRFYKVISFQLVLKPNCYL